MSARVDDRLELRVRRESGRVLLLAPDAGLFTRARDRGAPLTAGEAAGTLVVLGRAMSLVVPAEASGIVTNARPERIHAPVSYGDLLYELAPFAGAAEIATHANTPAVETTSSALVLRSPQTGRFYHRPAPGDPPFVQPGDVLEAGRPIGLVEAMKTFTNVAYRPGSGLPARARFVRHLVAHASDVMEGQALCEVEPA